MSYSNASGVTWIGEWKGNQVYRMGDVVHHKGNVFIVTQEHYSLQSTEPRQGSSWERYFSQLVSNTDNHIVDHYAREYAEQMDQEILESIYREAKDDSHLTKEDFEI